MADPKDAGKGVRDNLVASELAARELGQSLSYALENLAQSQRLLEKQAKSYTGLVGSSQLLNHLAKENLKVAQDLTEMYESELQVSNDLVLKRNMVSTQLQGEYAQLLTTYMLENDITDLNDSKVQLLVKQLKHRQEANQKLTEERDLYEEVATQTLAIRDAAESYKKTLKGVLATAQAIGNDPKTMGAFMLNEGIKKAAEFGESFEAFKVQGLSAGQAVEAQFKGMDLMSMMGLSDAKGVTSAMVSEFGNVNALSSETTSQLGRMAVEMGITGEEAGKLAASLSIMPGETAASAANAMEQTKHLAEMQGIAPGKIMKDMAANTGEMARAGNKGAEGFGKSVIALHKMGVEMSTASKIADGLLDFESSINAQMEASVLLGREINLDKARELALNNDIEGATAEVLKNVGGTGEFTKMNRVQQDALAKSAGMTVEELTKAVDAQEESNKYFGEGASLGAKALGTVVQVGSKAGGFLKENGMSILVMLQFMSQFNLMTKAGNVLLAAKNALLKVGKFLGIGKGPAAAATGGADKLMDSAGGGADKVSKVKPSSPGVGKGLKDIASGLKSMAGGKVLQGIGNLALFGPAALLAVPSIPFMIAVSIGGTATGLGLSGLAEGLKGKGMGAALVSVGIANLALYGLASVLGVLGIPFMIGVSMFGFLAGLGLKGLAVGLKAMGNPAVALGVGILSLLVLSVGAGMLMFGVGVGVAAAGMSLLVASLKDVPFENLIALPIAFMGIGAGLYLMGIAGLTAMPIIGALIALAVVAPALVGIGAALGGMFGGESGEKDDKMDELIGEIRELKAIMSQGGVVNMDGKKVGDVLRLAISTSGVR